MMIWALFNDVMQRIITLDKWEQRSNLFTRLKKIQLPPGSKALDFGCGTGLFARVFEKEGFRYWGYDVDSRLITFASRLYPACSFTTSHDVLEDEAPFDLIIANCCFHHIDDTSLSMELKRIKSLLADQGSFFVIDLLLVENDASFLHRAFMKLERGKHVRTVEDYHKHVERHFSIIQTQVERSHIFSFNNRLNPLYNDLAVLECRKKGGRA
jgi:cyclopropane fatty-acyl-phospholipid synthase-like methyltransferase